MITYKGFTIELQKVGVETEIISNVDVSISIDVNKKVIKVILK